jgi:hypothetical protein
MTHGQYTRGWMHPAQQKWAKRPSHTQHALATGPIAHSQQKHDAAAVAAADACHTPDHDTVVTPLRRRGLSKDSNIQGKR